MPEVDDNGWPRRPGNQDDENDNRQPRLFQEEIREILPTEPLVKRPLYPVWTENKARLIDRYLYYFVLITKHGAYIDGFAGPQKPDQPNTWAAKLVLETEPRWLRHFYLFDKNKRQVQRLRDVKGAQPQFDGDGKEIPREIRVEHGDFNLLVDDLLRSGAVGQKEATFCLLDQRTFECRWSTVRALAGYKEIGNNKIELFYFLAVGWIKRAMSGLRNHSILEDWWGRDDWARVSAMDNQGLVDEFVRRFRCELGYKSVKPWPIFERRHSGTIMYYMIHATDHPEAPGLMSRAYEQAVQPRAASQQILFDFLPKTYGTE